MVETGVPRKLRMDIIGHLTDEVNDHYTQFSASAAEIMSVASNHKSRTEPVLPPKHRWASPITREELEYRVWSQPTELVAKKMGMSGAALAKKCKKLAVNRPPRGFWAKVKAGIIKHPRGIPVGKI